MKKTFLVVFKNIIVYNLDGKDMQKEILYIF